MAHDYLFPDARAPRSCREYARAEVHRVLRGASDEYFLYITGEPRFVAHLSPERAMNALRGILGVFDREFGDCEAISA